jgi:hypothetical protein
MSLCLLSMVTPQNMWNEFIEEKVHLDLNITSNNPINLQNILMMIQLDTTKDELVQYHTNIYETIQSIYWYM